MSVDGNPPLRRQLGNLGNQAMNVVSTFDSIEDDLIDIKALREAHELRIEGLAKPDAALAVIDEDVGLFFPQNHLHDKRILHHQCIAITLAEIV